MESAKVRAIQLSVPPERTLSPEMFPCAPESNRITPPRLENLPQLAKGKVTLI